MRIAIDATPLSIPTGGVRRYTEELVRALALEYADDTFWLVSDQPFEMPDGPSNVQKGNGPPTLLDRRWWTAGLPRVLRRLSADVFHGTDFAVPYVPTRPSVMMIHDLSPWRDGLAEFTSRRVRHRTPLMLRLGLATMVITPSEAIRKEAIAHFQVPPNRAVAVPLAASELFRPVTYAARERPYFLFVGTPGPRKNLRVILEAFREIQNEAKVDLVIAGNAPGASSSQGVVYTGPLPDDALPSLYSGAMAFLYPSLYEGFGLPVLEAFRCGTMVIASKDAAVTEVAGGAAMQVEAADGAGWVVAMRAALSTDQRALWRERGLRRAADFSWRRTAVMTHEVYEEARRIY